MFVKISYYAAVVSVILMAIQYVINLFIKALPAYKREKINKAFFFVIVGLFSGAPIALLIGCIFHVSNIGWVLLYLILFAFPMDVYFAATKDGEKFGCSCSAPKKDARPTNSRSHH